MARVCFVSCLRWPGISESDELVERALHRQGVEVRGQPWNDPAQEFTGFDAVVLRSNWDCHFAADDFLAWLSRWEAMGARIWNPPSLVRWNLSTHYLLDLAAVGVPVVPTVMLGDAALRAGRAVHGPPSPPRVRGVRAGRGPRWLPSRGAGADRARPAGAPIPELSPHRSRPEALRYLPALRVTPPLRRPARPGRNR